MKKGMMTLCAATLAASMQANAVPMDFDFSGTFTKDNDVVLLNFTVNTASSVTIFSSSWDDGGFDPILAIWDSAGNRIEQQDDGGLTGSTVSNGVSYDYGVWDSYFTIALDAGTYTASIAQYSNFANGTHLSDGFRYDSNPNFRGEISPAAAPIMNFTS
ncbi:DVUA0089 family protein [Hahella sp. SMD15-11]|uniref:DVUA0089 family protein n=1 Tax=Thermohahella caldifontis TaxID=3142973 RepID=A0AB39UTR2_9GAMM